MRSSSRPIEIGEPIGHRRVDRIAGGARIAALDDRSVRRPAILAVAGLCARDHLGEDIDLLLRSGARSEQDVDDLLEIEQPERQSQIARIENERLVAEQPAVFVVGVQHENPQIAPRPQDFLQHEDHGARLADAGRAEHREVLAEHVVDIDVGADRAVLLQVPDLDDRGAGDVEYQPQLAGADAHYRVADRRILRHAALELRRIRRGLLDLSDEIEVGCRIVALLLCRGGRLDRYVGDHPDEQRFAGTNAEEFSNGGTSLVSVVQGRGQEPDRRLRATDGDDMANRLTDCQRRLVLIAHSISAQHGSPSGCKRSSADNLYRRGVIGG